MIRLLVFLLACVCSAADFTGAWNLTAKTADGRELKVQLVLKGEADKLAGTISSNEGSMDLDEVKVSGDDLSCKIAYHGGTSIALKASGNSLKGSFTTADGAKGSLEGV